MGSSREPGVVPALWGGGRHAGMGSWWMPWRMGPMKDVGGSDMPRGAASLALIRGFPNGGTHPPSWAGTMPCGVGGTQGSETSQYLQERTFRE